MSSFQLGKRIVLGLINSSLLVFLTACSSEEDIDLAGVTRDVVVTESRAGGAVTESPTGGVVTTTSGGHAADETAPEATPAVSVSWVAPVEREDGSVISMAEIVGYRVYCGDTSGDYAYQVDIADSATMDIALDGLAAGTYYFVVTVVDINGRESGFSPEVTRSI